jgi:hypothetical protein
MEPMSLIKNTRFSPFALGLFAATMVMIPARSFAGELTIAWNAAGPAASTSYRVLVGERPGVYDRVVDAGSALKATITDLPDGKIAYLAVKAVDAAGNESPAPSAELACMARPRVDSVQSAPLHPGGSVWVSLSGANFDREVQVRSSDVRLHTRATVLEPDGRLSVLVEAAASETGEAMTPTTASFTLFNPCRRADAFFTAHPRVADLDDSGSVDEADMRAVSAAFGTHRGENGYVSAADLDGDGIVDGRDLARVVARVGITSREVATLDAPKPGVLEPAAAPKSTTR